MSTVKLNSIFFFLILSLIRLLSTASTVSPRPSELYYVTPSVISECHKQFAPSCLTLQNFMELYGNVTTNVQNLSLVFLPGTHNLSSEFIIRNISLFSMSSEIKDSVSLICHQSARFTFYNVEVLKINGLNFFDCGENKVERVSNLSLINSTFFGGDNSRTSLIISESESSALIIDCRFINNTIGIDLAYNNTNVDKIFEEVQASIGGAMYIHHSNVTILRCLFDGNSAKNGGALYIDDNSNISTSECTFIKNKGSVIYATNSSINDNQSTYENNTAQAGAVICALHSNAYFTNSKFYGNEAVNKSGVALLYRSNLSLDNCEAVGNSAGRGGVVHHLLGTLTIKGSRFFQNSAQHAAAAVELENCTESKIESSVFSFNKADSVGVIHISKTKLSLVNTTIENNQVTLKGVIYAQDSFVESEVLSVMNNVVNLGMVYVVRCRARFTGSSSFINNSASFIIIQSNVSFLGTNMFQSAYYTHSLNESDWALLEGGALTSILSILSFRGETTFRDNYSKDSGGAIYATESAVNLYDSVYIEFNRATRSGGGVYLYRSIFVCEGNCSIVGNRVSTTNAPGGGVHAIGSSVLIKQQRRISESVSFDRKINILTIDSDYKNCTLTFENNSACFGGGLYFEDYSKLYILGTHTNVVFRSNTAEHGGAIFINDAGLTSICNSVWFNLSNIKTECFIQKLYENSNGYREKPYDIEPRILFEGNSANDTGSILYGGLLDRCTVSRLTDVYFQQYDNFGTIIKAIKGIDYFMKLSNMSTYSVKEGEIASEPVRICFCDGMHYNSSCSYHGQPPPIEVMKGEEFSVSLVAVDQVNQSITATAYSSVSQDSDLGENQHEKKISNECTNWTFSIISKKNRETLKIYAEGPCKSGEISTSRLEIKFKKCTCPIGFEVDTEVKNNCKCKCHPKLEDYVSVCEMSSNKSIIKRKSNVWIGYFEDKADFVIYPNCPFDYCQLPGLNKTIDLTFFEGSDSQCEFHRSGLLCGSCQSSYTLSAGSSSCIQCNSSWPGYLVLMLLCMIIFGIILVVVILVLDLTVANGTINGFLFYVNVVGTGSNAFLHFSNTKLHFLEVIIKFFNVTLGFDVCFGKNMNNISQTWISMLFPSYVFTMIIIIILLSKCSRKFAQVLGKGNPVAALATLTLLFYAKILRNTILIFSFAIINYPDNTTEVVWSPDANVNYFQGPHIPLFLVGVLIVVVIFNYTVLLFSWQWLLPLSNKRMFKWVRNTRLNLFMEANLAPYKPKYRFWTGLLLFIRIIIHIATAINFSHNPKLNLLSVGVSVTSLIMLKTIIGNGIYKKSSLDYLEFSFYFNIVLLTIATIHYFHYPAYREAVSAISVSLALIVFMGILVYHIVQVLRKTRCAKGFAKLIIVHSRQRRCLEVDEGQHHLNLSLLTSWKTEQKTVEVTTPTSSVVTMSPQHTSAMENEHSFSMSEYRGRLSSSLFTDN